MSSKLRSQLKNPTSIGVALSFYAFIAIGIAEGGLGVLIPSIQATFNLNSATITLLFLSQVSGYVFAALTSSLLSSRIGLARMLLLASFCLTCALITYAVSPYWLLMVTGVGAVAARVGLGIIPVLMIPLLVMMVILHRWLVERSPANQS